jgi:hypothetical protein
MLLLRCNAGDRLVEAQHINKSLSALGDVMAALASKNNHVPYRNSKLTQLLQDSLQGNAKVMMFMHISPEANMFSESVSTLKFASRVSQITLGQVGGAAAVLMVPVPAWGVCVCVLCSVWGLTVSWPHTFMLWVQLLKFCHSVA